MSTLDDILWNFNLLSMKFLRGREFCELKGSSKGSIHLSSVAAMNKLMLKVDEIAKVQICSLSLNAESNGLHQVFAAHVVEDTVVTSEVEEVLKQFEDVFREPKGFTA